MTRPGLRAGRVKKDMWHVIRDLWHVTCVMQQVGGGEYSLKEWSCLEEFEEKDQWVTELMMKLFVGQPQLHQVHQKRSQPQVCVSRWHFSRQNLFRVFGITVGKKVRKKVSLKYMTYKLITCTYLIYLCVRKRHSVSVTDILCLSKKVVSVTTSLCLLQMVCVYHRYSVSITDHLLLFTYSLCL